jgi:hypothetical protein
MGGIPSVHGSWEALEDRLAARELSIRAKIG